MAMSFGRVLGVLKVVFQDRGGQLEDYSGVFSSFIKSYVNVRE